jgi:hypothetical protein
VPSAIARACLAAALLACAQSPDALRYRLAGSGAHWDAARHARAAQKLAERYPDFFEVVLDPSRSEEPPTGRLREDLESAPVDRRNFDALNAVAIAYFELGSRGAASRRPGELAGSFRSAKLVALPWRAYAQVDDPGLRDAILDFFEDAGAGPPAAAGRLARLVGSLAREEPDPARRARIEALAAWLAQRGAEG